MLLCVCAGLVSYDEFQVIVKKLDPNITQNSISRMFREAYQQAHQRPMTKETFSVVCKKYGLVHLLDINHVKTIAMHEAFVGVSTSTGQSPSR